MTRSKEKSAGGVLVYAEFPTPLGSMLAVADARGLVRLTFQKGIDPIVPEPGWRQDLAAFSGLAENIRAYLSGRAKLRKTGLGKLPGTEFQKRVWARLRAIPFGRTRSYGEIAREIGKPAASRAVGAACGANPVPLFTPCHRVIGKSGALTGFSCGLEFKRALLKLEGILPGQADGAPVRRSKPRR